MLHFDSEVFMLKEEMLKNYFSNPKHFPGFEDQFQYVAFIWVQYIFLLIRWWRFINPKLPFIDKRHQKCNVSFGTPALLLIHLKKFIIFLALLIHRIGSMISLVRLSIRLLVKGFFRIGSLVFSVFLHEVRIEFDFCGKFIFTQI